MSETRQPDFYSLKSTYFYDLPEQLIAQHPACPRDSARLLICRRDGTLEDKVFSDIIDYLLPGDVLVVNKSKVIPARLYMHNGNGTEIELVLLRDLGGDRWECLSRPGKKTKIGVTLYSADGSLTGTVEDIVEGGNRIIEFDYPKSETFYAVLDRIGNMPLPPYITEKLRDKSEYQTVYAEVNGSAAAPTAGLHFTDELLDRIKAKGVIIAPVILHVGLGTFRPVKEENIKNHVMHSEYFQVPQETADAVNLAKSENRRVIAVGTTSLRTLEGAATEDGRLPAASGDTSIFIHPGYKFKLTDALITNFHLPESTLIMLVCALYGYDATMAAYRHAVQNKYRFFSFGDAMFISDR